MITSWSVIYTHFALCDLVLWVIALYIFAYALTSSIIAVLMTSPYTSMGHSLGHTIPTVGFNDLKGKIPLESAPFPVAHCPISVSAVVQQKQSGEYRAEALPPHSVSLSSLIAEKWEAVLTSLCKWKQHC